MTGDSRTINVYDLLKEKIQFMELKPGTRIVESELSNQFGVSRTPIREALKRLQEEDFIDIYPQRGTFVSKINFSLVKEIAYMRHVLENDIFLRLCREKIQVSGAVEDKLLMMSLALKNRDYKTYIQYDAQFHRSLFGCGGHEKIWDTVSGHLAHYTRVLVLDMMMPDSLESSYHSHLKIVEHIESGDERELEKIMDVHHDYYVTELDEKIKSSHPEFFE